MHRNLVIISHIMEIAIWLQLIFQFQSINFESMMHTTQEALGHASWGTWKKRSQNLQDAKKDFIWIIELELMFIWICEKQTDFCT